MSELTPKTGQKQDFSSKVVTPRNELAQVQLTTDEKKVLVGIQGGPSTLWLTATNLRS